jgi:Tfp pilus assembly protein PilF
MGDTFTRQRALELWTEAYHHHLRALSLAAEDDQRPAAEEMGRAIGLYSMSLQVYPTAEAYTFRGWAYNAIGRVDDAIEECKRAIEIDPGFGNPYNDIGAYLIAKGEFDAAVEWLEKAKAAPRYEPRHYPYVNLGRLYAAKGMVMKAIEQFDEALGFAPDAETSMSIERTIAHLRSLLN